MRAFLRARVPLLSVLPLVAACDALLGISEPIDGGAGDAGSAGDRGVTVSPADAAFGDAPDAPSAPDSTVVPESGAVDAPAQGGDGSADAPPIDGASSSCDEAGCSTLLTAAANVTSLWADNGTNLLWTSGDGGVYGCPLPACSPVLTLATGRPGPTSVLLAGNGNVYWAEDAGQGPAVCKNTACDGGVSYVTNTRPAAFVATAAYSMANWLVWFDTSLGVDDCKLPGACTQGSSVAGTVTPGAVSFFDGDGVGVYWAGGSTLGGIGLDGTPISMPTPSGTVGGLTAGTPVLWTDTSGLNAWQAGGGPVAIHLAPAPGGVWTPGAVAHKGGVNATIFWSGISGILDCKIAAGKCPSTPLVPTGIPTVSVLAASASAVFWVEPTGIWYAHAPL